MEWSSSLLWFIDLAINEKWPLCGGLNDESSTRICLVNGRMNWLAGAVYTNLKELCPADRIDCNWEVKEDMII
ncbi:hypothetical protein OGAPHI_002591 [Ogataea philodendri]|uniref:Uncharacterized protein n=1 Tax=Ogataea philodendri TaxID=1378263 RepID=A0A9P8T7I0_9ASCO|nr:uncharacterized protein OGAPHI_002591 [Ogataea philodendri]KAH3668836.1 hypothetical protein OGAPHI_002591 [Ogataea philodendri]